ncbi:MAG: phasin superfamily protein [Geobacteraceae bacterium]
MIDQLEKAFFVGLGAISLSKQKTEEFLAELKKNYRISEEEGKAFLDKAQERVREGRERLAELAEIEVKKVVDTIGLVPRDEFDRLVKRVEELEEKLRKN